MAARPRDPRKTTGLIGRTCKDRNVLSEPVLTVNDLVVSTGIRRAPHCHAVLSDSASHTQANQRQQSRERTLRRTVICAPRHSLTHDESPSRGRKPAAGFVGDHKSRETPDPIPNSEVKPGLPMILPRGKVGHRRLYGLCRVNPAEAFFMRAPGWAQSPPAGHHFAGNLAMITLLASPSDPATSAGCQLEND